jgi:KDO2-lipid IV(A) lauroyltransferase
MKLKEQIEYRATATVLQISKILPECAVYAVFKAFALLLHSMSARRRNLSLTNMKIAFPEKPENERKALVKKCYLNLSEGMALNILITTGRISDKQLLNMVETEDWGKFEKNIEASPNGFLAISGHMGNWELSSQYISLRLPRPLHVIARPTTNQLLEDRIVRPLREHFGVTVFYKKNALMRIMKAIKKGGVCGLLIDQKLKPPTGVMVDFFGKPAPTTASAALLQIRFGVTVNPAFMIRIAPRKYKLIIGDAVEWTDNGKSDEEQILELTRIHQGILEDIIREYPDQWFWMHNRWNLKGNHG